MTAMKKTFTLILLALLTLPLWSQTSRQFTVNITPDGLAKMEAYLPLQPTGRAIVDCPGGGYSHLATDHEGYDWALFFNERGIALIVLKYRMPHANSDVPISDAEEALRVVR